MKRIIGVDFDDVLIEFSNNLYDFYNAKNGTNYGREDMWSFQLDHVWGCTREEALQAVADFYESDEHWQVGPIVGSKENLQKIKADNDLVIISARPEYIKTKTLEWINKHYPNTFSDVIFGNHYHGNGTKRSKKEICTEIGAHIYIDDMFTNAKEVADSGVQVLLFDSPWNQGETTENMKRVYSWDEIYDSIKNFK